MKAVWHGRVVNHPARRGWRLSLAWFLLFAFAQQSFVTQTHVHFAAGSFGTATIAQGHSAKIQVADRQPKPDKFPARDDPANCPICQEIAATGHCVMPAAIAPALPAQDYWAAALALTAPAIASAVSHSWQGRAPPRL